MFVYFSWFPVTFFDPALLTCPGINGCLFCMSVSGHCRVMSVLPVAVLPVGFCQSQLSVNLVYCLLFALKFLKLMSALQCLAFGFYLNPAFGLYLNTVRTRNEPSTHT